MDVLMSDMEAMVHCWLSMMPANFFADDAPAESGIVETAPPGGGSCKVVGYSIEEDTVVPRAALPALIRGVKEMGRPI